jgi:DNA-binding response OmpR family regulator
VKLPAWLHRKKGSITEIRSSLPMTELRKRAKVVVIDDEADSFPTRSLQADGYTIEWWSNIDARGLQRLEAGDFDIVILDIQGIAGPGLSDTGDGQGILRRIKSVNPKQVVVAFSGQSYSLDSTQFWRLADDALRKPVTIIQCKELLDRLIQDHISVAGYWANITGLLNRAQVTPKAAANLEDAIVRAAKEGRTITLEDVRDAVGTIDSIQTIFVWARRLIALCTMI